ncbi:MAG TPA: hypothetical protein VMM15_26240 [Bradyrhizobium sp.]|nr:hypothetical protein [Bradyrhizobium sp.]
MTAKTLRQIAETKPPQAVPTALAERSASQVVEKLPAAPLQYRSDKTMQATSYSEEPSEQRVRAFPTPRRKTTKALQVSNDTKT